MPLACKTGSAYVGALERFRRGIAAPDDLVRLAVAELVDCGEVLPPQAGEGPGKSGRFEDPSHASACAARAYGFLLIALEEMRDVPTDRCA